MFIYAGKPTGRIVAEALVAETCVTLCKDDSLCNAGDICIKIVPYWYNSNDKLNQDDLRSFGISPQSLCLIPEGIALAIDMMVAPERHFPSYNKHSSEQPPRYIIEPTVFPNPEATVEGDPVTTRDTNAGFSHLVDNNGCAVIPDNVESISFFSESACYNLKHVIISRNVRKIHPVAFTNCHNLEEIDVDKKNRFYLSKNNCCLSKDGKMLVFGCANSVIPDGVSIVSDWAFSGSYNLTTLRLPEGVEHVGYCSFSDCLSLSEITLPDSLSYIGGSAFMNCKNLESISIPDNVKQIPDDTFSGCIRLNSVRLPHNVKNIGKNAFSDCRQLKWIDLPDGVDYIGDFAFEGCQKLSYFDIPKGVKRVEQYTFYRCSSLISVDIPNGVEEIGRCAFLDCYSLASITIPSSVKVIEHDAFTGCNLTKIVLYTDYESPEQSEALINNLLSYDADLILHVPFGCEQAYAGYRFMRKITSIVEN